MNAELKAKWVEALRSGKYRQAKGALIDKHPMGPKFCCLGVLADVAGARWTDIETEQGTLGGIVLKENGGSYLSPGALEIVGLDNLTQRGLAKRNDRDESFKKIADYIEKNL